MPGHCCGLGNVLPFIHVRIVTIPGVEKVTEVDDIRVLVGFIGTGRLRGIGLTVKHSVGVVEGTFQGHLFSKVF